MSEGNKADRKILDYNLNTVACAPSGKCGQKGFTKVAMFSGVHNCCDDTRYGNVHDSSSLRPQPSSLNYLDPSYTLPVSTIPYTARGQDFEKLVPIASEKTRAQGPLKPQKSCAGVSDYNVTEYNFGYLSCNPTTAIKTQSVNQRYGESTRNGRDIVGSGN